MRQSEHADPNYNLEPARHDALNKDYELELKTLDPRHTRKPESLKKQL